MSQEVSNPSKQEIGAAVEDFHLSAISGPEIGLQDSLKGKKGTLVVFWSSVCSHCVRYDGYLNAFTQQHPEIGLLVIASRQGETREQLRATAAARKLGFTILHDPAGQLAGRWFTQQTPRVFLIGANRVLLYRGAIDNFKFAGDPEYIPYLEPAIKQFLAGEALSRTETASFGCAVQSVYYNLPRAL